MLFHVKSFRDYNIMLKVIVTNYVPMLLKIVRKHKITIFQSPPPGIAYYLLDLNRNTLRYFNKILIFSNTLTRFQKKSSFFI